MTYPLMAYDRTMNQDWTLTILILSSFQVKMVTKSYRKKAVKGQCKSGENPWTYQHNLALLLESDKLTTDELLTLTCRDKYCIKSVMFESAKDRDDGLYRIFGDMVGQTVDFMRCWL